MSGIDNQFVMDDCVWVSDWEGEACTSFCESAGPEVMSPGNIVLLLVKWAWRVKEQTQTPLCSPRPQTQCFSDTCGFPERNLTRHSCKSDKCGLKGTRGQAVLFNFVQPRLIPCKGSFSIKGFFLRDIFLNLCGLTNIFFQVVIRIRAH